MGNYLNQLSQHALYMVAMSGGVDSSVAATLLVRAGVRVQGVMLRLWSESGGECINKCCVPQAVDEARKIATSLDIPFRVIDVSDLFREVVVKKFIEAYAQGKTPNPCVICNQFVRWNYLLDWALGQGARFLVTGHYACVEQDHHGIYQLKMGVDDDKDQSYMLCMLNQRQLSHTCLPIGMLRKCEVREIAHQENLSVADKKDSQDLCFLGNNDLRSFLFRYIPQAFRKGPIKKLNGEILGEHEGLAFYTIGQRKGLGISHASPLFVTKKDLTHNTLYVAESEELQFHELIAENVNWLSGIKYQQPFEAGVKIRYKSPLIRALIIPLHEDKFQAIFHQPLRDITPGQFAVIYQNNQVVAAGEII